MTHEEIKIWVTAKEPEAKAGICKQYPEVIIPAGKLHELMNALKNDPAMKMDYLFNETAADRKDGFHLIYHLTSSVHHHVIMVKVILTDKVHPSCITVSDIWKAAEFYEREIFDLFGIHFENHPDLRRIFLEDDWVGHPLRKDYKDEFTIAR